MDILNENNEVLKAGCIVIDDDKKVLLITTKNHDIWAYPKGHAESGETMEEVAIRETREETGYTVEINKRLEDLTYISTYDKKAIRVAMFLARPIEKVSTITDEIAEWKSLDEAKKLVLPNLKSYLEDFFRTQPT